MNYTIEGAPMPVVICNLEGGETMLTEKGAMSWMSPNMKMETTTGGEMCIRDRTMLAALAASHGDHFVRIMIQCLVSVGVIILSALGYLCLLYTSRLQCRT